MFLPRTLVLLREGCRVTAAFANTSFLVEVSLPCIIFQLHIFRDKLWVEKNRSFHNLILELVCPTLLALVLPLSKNIKSSSSTEVLISTYICFPLFSPGMALYYFRLLCSPSLCPPPFVFSLSFSSLIFSLPPPSHLTPIGIQSQPL